MLVRAVACPCSQEVQIYVSRSVVRQMFVMKIRVRYDGVLVRGKFVKSIFDGGVRNKM